MGEVEGKREVRRGLVGRGRGGEEKGGGRAVEGGWEGGRRRIGSGRARGQGAPIFERGGEGGQGGGGMGQVREGKGGGEGREGREERAGGRVGGGEGAEGRRGQGAGWEVGGAGGEGGRREKGGRKKSRI